MIQHVQAIFENGILRPIEPLNLPENARVQIAVGKIIEDARQNAETANKAEGDDPEAVAMQQRAWKEIKAELAKIPPNPNPDGFSGRDHDQILYGYYKK